MRAPAQVQERPSGVGARAALILAEAELWPSALGSGLKELGLVGITTSELHQLFEVSHSEPASLLVLAKRDSCFVVRACRALQGLEETPIIVVVSHERELIPALEAGADDVVLAAVNPALFAARVRALLRRAQRSPDNGRFITIRQLGIDLGTCRVAMNGRILSLTPTEFRILTVLARNAGRVVDARAILSTVHQHDYTERDAQNLLKVHIANLRRKLGDSRAKSPYILCIRGFGYMLERRAQRRAGDPLVDLIDEDDPSPA